MKQVEQHFGIPIEELLRIKFVDENKPHSQIADELNINYTTVIYWLKKAGIYSRQLQL
ncbi:MAG: helix-turn-helix domain containing protein [Candidatus Pacebacteria bacterium]|nr:helix-turn-helix domain containing protein [Candidatus Paceibacterota bacterium]